MSRYLDSGMNIGFGRRKHVRRHRGRGFFGDLWSGVKDVAGKTWNAVKDAKVISNVAGQFNPTLGRVAAAVGVGRRRRRHKVKRGGLMVGGRRRGPTSMAVRVRRLLGGRKRKVHRRKRGGSAKLI